ncbi:DUF2313 domain-containing protein [Lacticaseibacillus pabuli]|uniref:DUF2313 domain-containing protein n=1 Tax=Lacticaseibacillus pabuli TaxID=3025672 RepID=A0ABY7WV31_9LACO|nr:putative phage tail protein [Lacticaseibacillus sp. KACC 23028]WDF83644.1 DUF2313 domain-containing protein [Lacticaseibacillus sp. KACC 23028]
MKTQLTRLNDLIPDYYDDITEPHELAAAEQPLLDDLEAAISDAGNSQSVITADSSALSVYESALGIVPTAGESLETRRYNVLMEVLPPQPLTEPYLRQLLKMLNIDATVNIFGRQFQVDIMANPTDKGSTQRLSMLINRYLPANLTYTHSIAVPAPVRLGVAARLLRTYGSRSTLSDNRVAPTMIGRITTGSFGSITRTIGSRSTLSTERTVQVPGRASAGSAVQSNTVIAFGLPTNTDEKK